MGGGRNSLFDCAKAVCTGVSVTSDITCTQQYPHCVQDRTAISGFNLTHRAATRLQKVATASHVANPAIPQRNSTHSPLWREPAYLIARTTAVVTWPSTCSSTSNAAAGGNHSGSGMARPAAGCPTFPLCALDKTKPALGQVNILSWIAHRKQRSRVQDADDWVAPPTSACTVIVRRRMSTSPTASMQERSKAQLHYASQCKVPQE